jgi:hypothetical protein
MARFLVHNAAMEASPHRDRHRYTSPASGKAGASRRSIASSGTQPAHRRVALVRVRQQDRLDGAATPG